MRKIFAALAMMGLAIGPAWADGTIDTLSAAGTLTGTEYVPIFQSANPAVRTTTLSVSRLVLGSSGITGSIQCLHVSSAGVITGTGSDCGSGGGAVSSVFGRSGAVTATSGDYSFSLISGTAQVAQGGTGVTVAQGTGTKVQLSTGTTTTNDCVKFDASGNTIDAGAACGTGGSTSPGGTSGQIQYNNASSFGGFTMSGDCTLVTSTGVITCTKTNNVSFAPSATSDTTNAANISSGTLNAARLPNAATTTLSGAAGTITQTTPVLIVFFNLSGGAGSAALPTAGNAGRRIIVKDLNGNASTNNLTLTVNGGGTIDGQTSLVFTVNYQAFTLVDNGTSWSIVS